MQKSLWITRELLICNVFRDAKVLPPKCKSPNPLWRNGAPATIRLQAHHASDSGGRVIGINAKVLGIRDTSKTCGPRPSESWSMQRSYGTREDGRSSASQSPRAASRGKVLRRTSRHQQAKQPPSAVRVNLDDPPTHIRPIVPAISGCGAKEPFRFRPLRHIGWRHGLSIATNFLQKVSRVRRSETKVGWSRTRWETGEAKW
jgi:hypothetical protein